MRVIDVNGTEFDINPHLIVAFRRVSSQGGCVIMMVNGEYFTIDKEEYGHLLRDGGLPAWVSPQAIL